jgi:integrase
VPWPKARCAARAFGVEAVGIRKLALVPVGRAEEQRHDVATALRAKVAVGKPVQAVLIAYKRDSTAHLTVHRFVADWLADLEIRRQAGDLSPTYTRNLDRYAQPGGNLEFWREKTIHDISAGTVRDFGRWLALRRTRNRQGKETDQALSATTRRKVLGAFHAFCEWLRQGELIAVVPPFPKVPRTEHQPVIISMEAQAAVLLAIPWEERGAFLAAACGAGRGRSAPTTSMTPTRTRKAAGSEPIRPRARRAPAGRSGSSEPEVNCPASACARRDLSGSRRAGSSSPGVARKAGPDRVARGSTPTAPPSTGDRRPCGSWCAVRLRARSVPYEGTKHSTATDAIRRGVSLEQIQAALRHADSASTRVYAKLARGGSFDILRNPARVSHLYPAENRPENTDEINGLWRGGRDSNPQLPA